MSRPLPVASAFMMTYCQEAYISSAIEGIRSQECVYPYELVIGDDASSDRTPEICLEYQKRHPDLIKFHRYTQNSPLNYFTTLMSCRGKYIAICEGDDFWIDPTKLQKQIDYLEEFPGCQLVASNTQMLIERTQALVSSRCELRSLSIADMLRTNELGHGSCTVVFRRSCISDEDIRFLEEAPFGDWAMWLLCLSKGPGFVFPDYFGCYRIHPKGYWSGMNEHKRAQENLRMYSLAANKFPPHCKRILEYKEELASALANGQPIRNGLPWEPDKQ